MKLSSEAKVGLIGIVTVLALIWGINYLKGRNILKGNYTLYVFYPESGGLDNSAPVLLNGVKIGFVDEIILRTEQSPPIKVALHIEDEFTIAEASVAELYSVDLLGTKAIRIIPSMKQNSLADQDTILAAFAPDLASTLQSRIYPVLDQFGLLAGSLDTLSRRLDTLISQDALVTSLNNISHITSSLQASLNKGGSLDNSFSNLEAFTGMMKSQEEEMVSLITSLNAVLADLDSAGLDRLARELQNASMQFALVLEQVNSGEGSAGKFIYSDSLHENLNLLVSDLDSLVRNLNEHPEDYVQISVFGKSNKDSRKK